MILAAIILAIGMISLSFKIRFLKDVLFITLITLSLTSLAFWVTGTRFFRVYVYPESFTLVDWEVTDYAIAYLRPPPNLETRIVLVNVGDLSRRELAEQIHILSRLKPRVIAFNGFFNCSGKLRDSINCPQLTDTLGNLLLAHAIRDAGNVVLASALKQSRALQRDWEKSKDPKEHKYDSIEFSDDIFSKYSASGFVSMPLTEQNVVHEGDVIQLSRTFYPYQLIKGNKALSFPVQVCMKYDSAATNKFLARGKREEIINYRGNIDDNHLSPASTSSKLINPMFYVIDHRDILKGEFLPELVKGNIVLMGYLDKNLGDTDPTTQKLFTPLNRKVAGRANPDMYGTVVFANIMSMILNNDYIHELSTMEEFSLAFFACIAHVFILLYIFKRIPLGYDLIAVGLIVFQLGLYSWLRFSFFNLFNLKMSLVVTVTTLAIASISVTAYKELLPHIGAKFRKSARPTT